MDRLVAEEIQRLGQEITSLQGARILPIYGGFSSDRKYVVGLEGEQKRLLRVFDPARMDNKQKEFSILQEMERYGVKSPRALELGRTSWAGYMLVSYIDGEDAERNLPEFSDAEQLHIGIETGVELRKMHQLQAPEDVSSWYERKVRKHYRYMEQYEACPLRINNEDRIIAFIDEHIRYMQDRPNLFQHDDVHPANLVVKDRHLAGIIDFERYDWGDPIHEFLKLGFFGRHVSIPYCIGQIQGYLDGEAPDEEFWTLYSLYTAMALFSSVVWTLKTAPETMDTMQGHMDKVLEDHNYFQQVRPSWYDPS